MKHIKYYSRRTKFIATFLGIVLVSSLTLGLLLAWHPSRTKEDNTPNQQETAKKQEAIKTPETKTNDPPKQNVVAIPTSSSPACKLFTKSVADQALKIEATLNTDSALTSETEDLQISFCTYSAQGRALTLVAFLAKTDVGKSMNSIEFGSGRPADVQNVTTIGQAAFWNESLATLYVLKNNNRYTIALTNGTLDETLEAAKVIVPNL
jgi:hypothetical protein